MDREALMLSTSFWLHPAVIGLIVGIPSAAVGILGYRRAVRVDQIAEQAGIATTAQTSIGQVVDGLNRIITNLQTDNDDLREDVAGLRLRVETIIARVDAVEIANVDLRVRNRELEQELRLLRGRPPPAPA